MLLPSGSPAHDHVMGKLRLVVLVIGSDGAGGSSKAMGVTG